LLDMISLKSRMLTGWHRICIRSMTDWFWSYWNPERWNVDVCLVYEMQGLLDMSLVKSRTLKRWHLSFLRDLGLVGYDVAEILSAEGWYVCLLMRSVAHWIWCCWNPERWDVDIWFVWDPGLVGYDFTEIPNTEIWTFDVYEMRDLLYIIL